MHAKIQNKMLQATELEFNFNLITNFYLFISEDYKNNSALCFTLTKNTNNKLIGIYLKFVLCF